MKVSIIGTGHVGTTIAFTLVVKGGCDELLLVNRTRRRAEGEAADLQHAAAFSARQMRIEAGSLQDTASSDVIVLAQSVPAGSDLKSRNDLAKGNAVLMRDCVPRLAELNPNAIFIVVTNPVDVMTHLVLQLSGLSANQVIGTGTLIDSARFRTCLSQELSIHPDDIRAYVLGEHGDTQFPVMSMAATGGRRLDEPHAFEQLFKKTVASGSEIFSIKGYTNYAIALASSLIIETILTDGHRTLPVSTLIDGFEDQRDVCLSVPSVVGRKGILERLYPRLNELESQQFRKCGESVRRVISEVSEIGR